MNRALAVVAVGCVLLACACGNAPTRESCEKLLVHTVELEQQAAGPSADPAKAAAQSARLVELARKQFMETCEKDLPEQRVACGLKAATKADLLACDDR